MTRTRSYFPATAVLAAMALLCVVAGTSAAAAGDTTRLAAGYAADVSTGGRYVAFVSSDSARLVEGDTNGFADVFVRDRDADADGILDEAGAVSTELVSVDDSGNQANGHSRGPSVSNDGRYVVFISEASNLVEGDTNGVTDAFVHNLQAGTTQPVSVNSSGAPANGETYDVDISDSERVAFVSEASDLVAGDTNEWWDYFVRDLQTGTTERVNEDEHGNQVERGAGVMLAISISANGRYVGFTTAAPFLDPDDPGDHWDAFVRDLDPVEGQRRTIWRVGYDAASPPSISDDGLVAFTSYATTLVPGDTNGVHDVFVRDLEGQTTRRVSVSSSGTQANANSHQPSISADGGYVTFRSSASSLVAGDTNGFDDVFVHDVQGRTTERVSVSSSGTQANARSNSPSISSGGRYVTFDSAATNLVSDDPSGNADVFVYERGSTQQPGDATAPTTTHTLSPSPNASGWNNTDVAVSLSARDNAGGSGVREINYRATGAQTISSTAAQGDSASLNITAEGTTTISYFATDNAGNEESPVKTLTVRIDKSAPRVSGAAPTGTGIGRSTDVEATFSEKMDPASIDATTFRLYKCPSKTSTNCTTQVTNVAVSLSADGLVATLDPFGTSANKLNAGSRYMAVVTTGTKDVAGNALDQDQSRDGNQQKAWYFTTRG